MRNLNLEGFNVCFQRFVEVIKGKRHIEMSCDEEQIVTDYLSGYKKEVVAIRNAASEEEYEQFRDALVPAMLYLASKIENFEKLFFDDKLISYNKFYNTACFLYKFELQKRYSVQQMISLSEKELSSISLKMLLELFDKASQDSSSCKISEIVFFEQLSECSLKELSLVFSYIDTDSSTLTELKKSMLKKDVDNFVTILMTSNIDYQQAAYSLAFWKQSLVLKEMLGHVKDKVINTEEIKNFFFEFRKNGLINSKHASEHADIVYALEHPEDTNIDWEHWMYNEQKGQIYFPLIHCICCSASLNLKEVAQMEHFLNEKTESLEIFTDFLKHGVSLDEYVPKPIHEFAIFKEEFLSRLTLPKAVKNKTKKEYLESVILHDKNFCTKLYYALTNEGYLSYDDDVLYSFVSRMSYDYIGEKEPNQIVWYGEARDLYYFINWFAGDHVYKKWEKTAKYYALANGKTIKTNGVTNQAKTSSQRMDAFMKKNNLE
ncbi:hypothetical protein [Prevotella sp.]|uniref:hypothetical protein n=1 Tax=Prevotella sp. TaxID=59823 RepID=UPI0025CB8A75|nr:hypothetical protein [Prevotella sp.]